MPPLWYGGTNLWHTGTHVPVRVPLRLPHRTDHTWRETAGARLRTGPAAGGDDQPGPAAVRAASHRLVRHGRPDLGRGADRCLGRFGAPGPAHGPGGPDAPAAVHRRPHA